MNFLNKIAQYFAGIFFATVVSITSPNPITSPAPITVFTPSPSPSPSLLNEQSSIKPAKAPTPKPNPQLAPATSKPTSNKESYLLEDHPSGQEGFYVLKNTPDEPMASQSEVNQAVNQYRLAHGLTDLFIDQQLCDIATTRAQEADINFSHELFQTHIEKGDYNFTGFHSIGENLWQGSFTGVHIVEFGWDRSPGHRANLQGDWNRGCAGIHNTTVAFIFAK